MDLTCSEDYNCPIVTDLRIVLLGKTGSGKSATANTIVRREAFMSKMSLLSVTHKSQKETSHFNKRTVSVIDTPGIYDTSMTQDQLKGEIENCIKLSVPGPHVFLFVIRLDCRFTEEEKSTITWIKENFGEDASKFTVVVFTHEDILGAKPVEKFVNASPDLSKIIRDCQGRYVGFDNTRLDNRTQVSDLLEMIDKMVMLNGGHYTSSIYEEAQKKMRNDEWWRTCGDTLGSSKSLTIAAAATASVATVLLPNRLASSAVTALATGGLKALSEWMKPKTNEKNEEEKKDN